MDVPSYITVGGWFIQVIFDKYLSSQLQTWATNSGIGEDLDKLRIAMLRVQSVLSCAEKTRSEGILGWMKELRDVSYDAEDLLDELEYCRLQQQLDAESSSPFLPITKSTFSHYLNAGIAIY
ncbi:disease resistance protein RGA3 [Canna indica]|uniref:Disease resistance protein RGA3 n=1 Tax=Canna indica TaxID=4628 RepID=A0AAQ3KU00_9LILI|nr:disease resistance protein RGA3 [Canna indica]